jgi:hypothetical protein
MVVGNMMAGASGGDSVIATAKCNTPSGEKDCVVGSCAKVDSENVIENGEYTETGEFFFVNRQSCKEMMKCSGTIDGQYINCTQVSASGFVDIRIENGALCTDMLNKDSSFVDTTTFMQDLDDKTKMTEIPASSPSKGPFVVVESASVASSRQHAYAIVELDIKPLGYTSDEWSDLSSKVTEYYYRNSNGSVGKKIAKDDCVFEPSTRDADDGALVDISNQARAKATLIGTATGGAMGGFAAYQGAKGEITERWTAAVHEYEDSLTNFVCVTGGRYLAKYNDYLEIPEAKKLDE